MPNDFYYYMYNKYNLKLSLEEIEEIREKIKLIKDEEQKN